VAIRRPELSAALGEDYPRTFVRLQRMFRARGIPAEEAADLAQETAARLIAHLDRRGEVAEDPMPLIHRIATNLMIDRARSHDRRVVSLDPIEHDSPAREDVVEEVSRRHRRRVVRNAIEELSDRQRTAIALSLDGMSPVEIAERLGLERNAADALLFRARRSLADRLKGLREELHGIGLVAIVKIRSMARRGSDAPAAPQMVAASPAFMNVASAALVLAVSAFGQSAPALASAVRGAAPTRAGVHAVAAAPAAANVAGARASTGGDARGNVVRHDMVVNAKDTHVRVVEHVGSGDDDTNGVGVDIWRVREGQGGSYAGPALDAASSRVCADGSFKTVCGPRE
jgi:RNA polymerase sigma factor (sigma-70 family)